ncbi:lactate dehydrogenase [Photobacterium kishitanii]|uniref:2-hydroxyacid dehydrogenase n=1 Tax=Photobacterium kishitanii TaxID=318456 RepID=A0AAX0YSX1_9GAMM|nr:2-hydroxyacid dehydrogenase [Photobacterium kishitanii]KJG10291.1 lactate dehydrogenase [Photobacterium kishitanii]KJG56261.1 lactate dehydrogenase [Photobacterium kishitanii]KJG60071.1 lactate dehydrogenase [Photobacterium kishitanii]KJG64389.1 lactate dehydrogenase [Photobacterium kishitanii]KJG68578.1 lactate dehydrogenase [Photobacterium kishitanii]
MKIAVFSTKGYDQKSFAHTNKKFHQQLTYFDFQLNHHTAKMAEGFDAICAFVNDDLSEPVLKILAEQGVKIIAMRCAGFDRVDLDAAKALNIQVVTVPAYSPESIAEHTLGLMLSLNRRIHRAYQRTRDANFSLEGLTGYNFHGRTVGVIGTGKIGIATIRILKGLGMNILAYDPYPNPIALELGVTYTTLDEIYEKSNVITLHCPMSKENYHMLNRKAFAKMRKGMMIINTSRGGLLNSSDAVEALKSGIISALGVDVYENEKDLFFQDKSNDIIQDDVFRRLSSCHNVLFTGHQAFLTEEALGSIAQTTLENLASFEKGELSGNELIK